MGREEIIRKYRKEKRRRLKSQINELIKANKDIFNLLVYGKSLDEHFLKKKGRQNLLEIEKLETAYDKALCEKVTDEMLIKMGMI